MAKVEILHIWNYDGDHWITAHATKKQRDLALYDFAMELWDGYEDLPDPDGLGQAEAIEMWTEASSDYYGYEFSSTEIKELQEAAAVPEDAVFVTEKELDILTVALHLTNVGDLQKIADPKMSVEDMEVAIAQILEKLKI